MVPDCRAAETFSIPKFDLVKEDVEGLIDELRGYQSQFHDCFLRSESREHFFHYTVGQLSHFERKSIEPIALKVSGAKSGLCKGLSATPFGKTTKLKQDIESWFGMIWEMKTGL